MNNLRINLIVAIDDNFGISANGKIPWSFKEDFLFFQDVTKRTYQTDKKNAIIMAKNTWKCLPENSRGLKDRINIVISNSMSNDELIKDNATKSEVYLTRSLQQAFALCNELNVGKIFIGGGSNLYKEALDQFNIDEIYLTKINRNYGTDNSIGNSLHQALHNHKYNVFFNKEFLLIDENINEKVPVQFIKYYKGEIPPHLCNNPEEQNYLDLLETIIKTGHFRKTRNANVWSTFGHRLEYDLSKAFPIITTKKVNFYAIFEELMWFLRGDTNAKHLSEKGIKIWDGNTTRKFLDANGKQHLEEGDIGPIYSFNFRHFGAEYEGMSADYTNKGFDQIQYCLNELRNDKYSRRIIATTHNPSESPNACLYPCHGIAIQFYVEADDKLSCMMFQRSVDSGLGYIFNVSSYSLLVHFFCEILNNGDENMKFSPGRLIMILGDTHIYEEHYSAIVRQILREPRQFPQIKFNRKVKEITDFKFEDVELVNYEYDPFIPMKMVA